MSEDTHRQVTIERITNSHYTVTNARGGTITVGTADCGAIPSAIVPYAVPVAAGQFCDAP